MEKNEHAILLDIPSGGKNGKYHSAVLTTYAIDLIHFDNQLLNMLHRKQVCSINVFADTNQMDKSMEYVSPIYIRHIGKEYSITSISAVGAFHPKINFFVGDDAVLVVFGTGNLTVTGHGKNHEAFTGFMIDETDIVLSLKNVGSISADLQSNVTTMIIIEFFVRFLKIVHF